MNMRRLGYWPVKFTIPAESSASRPPPRSPELPQRVFGLKLTLVADDSFKEFVLDQLSALSDLRAKAMFGAHGLYCDDKFFGILDEGRLFFKTDAQSGADYTARGMGPFTYEMKGKVVTMSFHEVPPEVLEQPHELVQWARKAIAIAAIKSKKPARRKI
jgi:DNA transformation protein